MGTIKCRNLKDKGCSFFRLMDVSYAQTTCQLTDRDTKIGFLIEGGVQGVPLEQFKLHLEAATNTHAVEFSTDMARSKGSIDVSDKIDPGTNTPIIVRIRKVPGATFSTNLVTVQCQFWHGDAIDLAQEPHHRITIILKK